MHPEMGLVFMIKPIVFTSTLMELPQKTQHVAILQAAHTHMLHGAGIFTNICPENCPNVGKQTSTMEHLGYTK